MSISFDELNPGDKLEIETDTDFRFTIEVVNASRRFLEAKQEGQKAILVFAELPQGVDLAKQADKIMPEAVQRIETGLAAAMLNDNGQAHFWVQSVQHV